MPRKAKLSEDLSQLLKNTFGPLFLILVCPPTVILFWYANTALGGSLQNLLNEIIQNGFFQTLYKVWSPIFFGSTKAWTIIGVFAATQLLFMKILPGKTFIGPITPKGNSPVYKANGPLAYASTLLLFFLAAYPLQLFSPTIIYDNFGPILGALNIFSLFFCLFLLVKGLTIPSCTDAGPTGKHLFDYYWGTELYPRILGWDIKQFTNCRFGMMSWALIIISFAAKQHELHGLSDSMIVAVALQLIYITKFFFWETGYLGSLDIMHDRAGFYICWGCLVWVPGIYTSATYYLVNHPNHLGYTIAALIFILGAAAIVINYFADRQRQRVRATKGQCLIWGKTPRITVANYHLENGTTNQSVLLLSGWWGIARHFHYIPELVGAFCWTVPALFENFLPWFYVVYLTVLLVHRAFRDDERCAKKYGTHWDEYCEHVPYKLIPFVV